MAVPKSLPDSLPGLNQRVASREYEIDHALALHLNVPRGAHGALVRFSDRRSEGH
jgi:hypothetical protein